MVCDKAIPAADLTACIKKHGGKLLQEAKLFDVYTGHHIPEGKKSMAFSLVLRAEDKTMTDAEADAVMKSVLAGLEKDLGAVIR